MERSNLQKCEMMTQQQSISKHRVLVSLEGPFQQPHDPMTQAPTPPREWEIEDQLTSGKTMITVYGRGERLWQDSSVLLNQEGREK